MITHSAMFKMFMAATLTLTVFSSAHAYWHESSKTMMGTQVSIKFESESKQQAEVCSQQAYTEIDRIENLLSTYKPDSEISNINRRAGQHAVKISSETFDLIRLAIHHSMISDGAFDITYESVGYQYDLKKNKKPNDTTIKRLLPAINYRHIVLRYPTIFFKNPNVKINLGGIGKGYAIENAAALLKTCGINEAIISAGGDSKILGDHHGKEWIIGIQHPRQKNKLALRIPLSNIAISTSGDYERYYMDNGKRIHHIINPKTGKPSSQSWSASVIGNDATVTDALSTTVFILGEKKGLELINSLDGIDAIVIDAKGKVHYSNGLKAYAQR